MNVLLVPAHPGFPGQIPQSRKTVVCVCVITGEPFTREDHSPDEISLTHNQTAINLGKFINNTTNLKEQNLKWKWAH